jgi:PadR family transcriptional regulator AphA
MPRENKTKYIILGLLSHDSMTGYDIRQAVKYGISNFWTEMSYEQIYPTLKQLKKAGLAIKTVDVEETQRVRKVYSITPKGQAELQIWLTKPPDKEVFKLDILLKLYFGAQTSLETNIDHIKEFEQRNQQFLTLLTGFEKQLRTIMDESEDHPFILLTILFGQYITRAQLDWAKMTKQTLQEKAQ